MKLIKILCLAATVCTIFVALFGYLLQDSRHAILCSYPENLDKLSCIGYNNSLLPNESYTTPYYDIQDEYEDFEISKNYTYEDFEYTTNPQLSTQKENEATTHYKSIEDYSDFEQTNPQLGNNNLSEIHSRINQMTYSENFDQTNSDINLDKEFKNQPQATTPNLIRDKAVDNQTKTPNPYHNRPLNVKYGGQARKFKETRKNFNVESLKFKQAIHNLSKNYLLRKLTYQNRQCDLVRLLLHNGYDFSMIKKFSTTASRYLNEIIKLYTLYIRHSVSPYKKLYKFTNLRTKMTEISKRDILFAFFCLCIPKEDLNKCDAFRENNNLINENMKNLFETIILKGMNPNHLISRSFLDELGEIMQIPLNMILNCTSEFNSTKMNFLTDLEYQKFYDDVNLNLPIVKTILS